MRVAAATLVVSDYDEAIRFFVDAVGLPLVEDTLLGDGKRWVVVGPGLLLAKGSPVGGQAAGRVAFFLHTKDFAADHARMTAAGVRFLEAPRHEAYGTVAVFEDLYGNRWDLVQRAVRTTEQRIADARAALAAHEPDAWVAAGDHMVPLTLAWVDERIVLCTNGTSAIARAITTAGRARLGLGETRDVVLVEAVLERTTLARDDADLAARYSAQAGWDPLPGGNTLFVLRPDRIQVWREADELAGRTVLRDGRWLATSSRSQTRPTATPPDG